MKFSEMIIKSGSEIAKLNITQDFEVNKLCYNSNMVEPGDIFFAIRGFKSDGNKYIPQAFSKGAAAVFTDNSDINLKDNVYIVPDCRKTMAEMSGIYYGHPSLKMKMIGVTGTNGNIINKKNYEAAHTTPESVDLNNLLNEMVKEGVEYVTMEVSSHALELNRVFGIEYDAAVFTNLTPEHLDFHDSMEDYFNAKKRLFDSVERINKKGNKTSVIYNLDDEFGNKIVENSGSERISFGFNSALYSAKDLRMDFSGMNFDMLVPYNGEGIDRLEIETSLTGRFNVYNIMASAAVLKYLGISYGKIKEAVKVFKAVDGRFNQIILNNGAIAIIDYSHTPDSLMKAISTIREILNINNSTGKIITVFGCGGDRDKTKRPVMGEIATRLSDTVIITSDNPRTENPEQIITEIVGGTKKMNYIIEADRGKAIVQAIKISGKDDVVLVAGKGHETYQEINGVKNHFSDREIAERYI